MKTENSFPHKPHDQFFRFIFSGKPQVVSFLKGSLPEDIQAKLDFESLQLMSGHHIDDQLRDHLSDLLYTCQFEGHEIGIAILLGHRVLQSDILIFRFFATCWDFGRDRFRMVIHLAPLSRLWSIMADVGGGISIWRLTLRPQILS